jgi:hypothetical protein
LQSWSEQTVRIVPAPELGQALEAGGRECGGGAAGAVVVAVQDVQIDAGMRGRSSAAVPTASRSR